MANRAWRVLVVDDDQDTREAIAGCLEDLGVEAIRAGDDVEGLAHLEAGPAPQAILLDLCAPRLHGDGFRAAMRRNPCLAAIPIVSMTSASHGRTVQPAQPRGAYDFGEVARILVSLCEREVPSRLG